MEELTLQNGGMTVAAFEVKDFTRFPEIHVRVAAAGQTTTLTFYRSTDAQTWTQHPETLTFDEQDRHEPLYGLKPGEWVKITSNKMLSNAKIRW